MPSKVTRSHQTRSSPRCIDLQLDIGGKYTRASIGRRNAAGHFEVKCVTSWPGTSDSVDHVPTLVVESKSASPDGHKKRYWGYDAKNVLNDFGPQEYNTFDKLKDWMMHLTTERGVACSEKGDMENRCFYFAEQLLKYLLGSQTPDSLLLLLGAPVHVANENGN
ncbi:hypothetical protein Q7P37_010318 [Cladosporium fusiforme]